MVQPAGLPEVVWRAGLDLNPLDVTDPADLTWLEALIWPKHTPPRPAAGRRRTRHGRTAPARARRSGRRPASAGRTGASWRDPGGLPHVGALSGAAAAVAGVCHRGARAAGALDRE